MSLNCLFISLAIILNQNKEILIGRRPKNTLMKGIWEFPGGKIEKNESPEQALKRELKEELAIEVKIKDLKPLSFCTHHYAKKQPITLLCYSVKNYSGCPCAIIHEELKWIPFNAIGDYSFPEANKKLLPSLKKLLFN